MWIVEEGRSPVRIVTDTGISLRGTVPVFSGSVPPVPGSARGASAPGASRSDSFGRAVPVGCNTERRVSEPGVCQSLHGPPRQQAADPCRHAQPTDAAGLASANPFLFRVHRVIRSGFAPKRGAGCCSSLARQPTGAGRVRARSGGLGGSGHEPADHPSAGCDGARAARQFTRNGVQANSRAPMVLERPGCCATGFGPRWGKS